MFTNSAVEFHQLTGYNAFKNLCSSSGLCSLFMNDGPPSDGGPRPTNWWGPMAQPIVGASGVASMRRDRERWKLPPPQFPDFTRCVSSLNKMNQISTHYGRTPLHKQVADELYNGTNGHVYNLSTACPLQICHKRTKNARAQHLDMSRCWALILPLPDLSTACPCSGV